MEMRFARLLLFALVSLLVISQPLDGRAKDYVHLKWVDKSVPDVEWLAEGSPLVALPLSIKDILDRHFPQYRVPGNQDYEGDWAANYDSVGGEYPHEKLLSERLPFLAFGDFNHDGTDDIAMLIVGVDTNDRWKLIVFHHSKNGYRHRILVSSPEARSEDSRKRRNYGPINRFGIRGKTECTDRKPCVVLDAFEAAQFEYLWTGTQYVENNIHD